MPDYKGKRFVIIIDDLDRCLPDKAFSLIESIRFYLQNKNTLVILGINDKVIAKYINDYYPLQGSKDSRDIAFDGDDFMKKIIQWGYELPPVDYSNIKEKFGFNSIRCDEGFDEVMASAGYLSFRKWFRIYNRLKGIEISQGNVRKGDIGVSIIAESFPKIERYLRQRPDLVMGLRFSNLKKEKKGELLSDIQGIEMYKDKTVVMEILRSILPEEE